MADLPPQLTAASTKPRFRRESHPRSPGLVTAMEVDGSTLRVAQSAGRASLKRVVTTLLDLPAAADRTDPLALGAAVGRALAELRLKPSAVVMGVPRARVVLRSLLLPLMQKPRELASLVHFQIAKDLPFRLELAVVDFKIGRQVPPPPERTDASGKPEARGESAASGPRLEALVAVVQRDVVEFYRRLAESAGLKLDALGLLPDANVRCAEACQITDGDDALALVSLRPDEVGVEIIAQQSLVFSRGAVLQTNGEGAGAGKSAPATAGVFAAAAVIEAVRSLHGYGGMESNTPVGKVIVTGATGCEEAVLEGLRLRLKVPCARLDPATDLRLPDEAREAAAGSMGVIGLALGFNDPQGLPFDFLNPKRPAARRNIQRIRLLTLAAGIAVLLIGFLGLRAALVGKRLATLNAANAELADAEKKRPTYRQLVNQSAVVEDWVKGGRDWLEHYAYLTSVLPPSEEIYLTSLSVSGQGSIRLAVQARSGETLARLEKELRAAGYEVKPLAITPGPNRFGYEFRSTVELLAPAKLKIDRRKLAAAPRPADDVSLEPKAWKRGGP
jgi:Tfp pilus assembly PilM family ATPase